MLSDWGAVGAAARQEGQRLREWRPCSTHGERQPAAHRDDKWHRQWVELTQPETEFQ